MTVIKLKIESSVRIFAGLFFRSLLFFMSWAFIAQAQEHLAPMNYNPFLNKSHSDRHLSQKTTALSLPFFEDFAGYDLFPDNTKWLDNEVYINNTMGVSPISRGVATFDALNQYGLPYDTLTNTFVDYADSLTSQPINLDFSQVVPGDSIYFSFFFQPQGNGFYPLPQDSLMLYFKNRYGTFMKVWSAFGTTLQPFQQVLLPITDSIFFHPDFQFRFVNMAALYWADAIWNVDYIKLDKNRNMYDTIISDIAMTSPPTNLLNDYTSMPYHQFIANTLNEVVTWVNDSIRNNNNFSQILNYYYFVTDGATGSTVSPIATTTSTLSGYQTYFVSEPLNLTYPVYPPDKRVVFNSNYYIQTVPASGPAINDTIVQQQIFDNYLAYDDGTAEQSYYLTLDPSGAIPGEISIEFHLNQPDTLRGMAIYFGRQVPLAKYKQFSLMFYSSLADVNGASYDIKIREQDFIYPGYLDTINHFWIYKLDTPIILPAGTFFAGTQQPAFSASDSLYFGFDVNRIGGNHAYYRVTGAGQPWTPSSIQGAIMMRPLIGHDITASFVKSITKKHEEWQVTPNPTSNEITLLFEGDGEADYVITGLLGNLMLKGKCISGKTIDISGLGSGSYIINAVTDKIQLPSKLFIKL